MTIPMSCDDLYDELLDGPGPRIRQPVARSSPRSVFALRRPTLLDILVIASIVGVLAGLLLPTGGDHDYRHRFPAPRPGSQGNLDAIAGEYYQGDGLGRNWRLALRDDAVYSFIWSGCLGVYERESGYVADADGLLTLTSAQPTEKKWPRQFYLVQWGTEGLSHPPRGDGNLLCRGQER